MTCFQTQEHLCFINHDTSKELNTKKTSVLWCKRSIVSRCFINVSFFFFSVFQWLGHGPAWPLSQIYSLTWRPVTFQCHDRWPLTICSNCFIVVLRGLSMTQSRSRPSMCSFINIFQLYSVSWGLQASAGLCTDAYSCVSLWGRHFSCQGQAEREEEFYHNKGRHRTCVFQQDETLDVNVWLYGGLCCMAATHPGRGRPGMGNWRLACHITSVWTPNAQLKAAQNLRAANLCV